MEKIIIENKSELLCFDPSDLKYVTSSGRTTTLHGKSGDYRMYAKLDEIEALLPECFARCHRSVIVNMNCIALFCGKNVTLSDGTTVPVSKSRYLTLRESFCSFINRNGGN